MTEDLKVQDWEYESLMNDAMFHMVFVYNEKARRALVSTLLNIPENQIVSADVLNPMQFSDAIDAKLTVLDIKVHLNNDTYVNIEMQVRRFGEWTNRSVVYNCRQITEQANVEGFTYSKLEPVIHVAIMNHTLFQDHKRFFARYRWQDDEGYLYSDKVQFYIMDLKAISQASEDEKQRGLVEWAEAFKADNWDKVREIENDGVKEAVKQMQTIMNTPAQRQFVWDRRIAQLDYTSAIEESRVEGRAEERKAFTMKDRHRVWRMHEKGRSPDEIADDMELSVDTVKQWIGMGKPALAEPTTAYDVG